MRKSISLLGTVASCMILTSAVSAAATPSSAPIQVENKQETFSPETLLSIEGELTEDDETARGTERYDRHFFSGQKGQAIAIALKSDEFDPVLRLSTETGETIGENDDSDEGTTAKITIRLPFTGNYEITASSFDDSGRGRYQLLVTTTSEEEAYRVEQTRVIDQLVAEGFELYQSGQLQEANELYERALEIAIELGYRENEAAILNNIGLIFHGKGNYSEAMDFYQRSLNISNEIDLPYVELLTLNNIGTINLSQGNYSQAIDYYERSIEISKILQSIGSEIVAVNNIGGIYLLQGNYAQALETFERNLTLIREVGDDTSEAQILGNIGNVYLTQGSYAEARDYFQQALQLGQKIDSPVTESLALTNIGGTYFAQENYEQAISYLEQSLSISQSLGDRTSEAITLVGIGSIYLAQEELEQASDYLMQGLEIAKEIGNRSSETLATANIATAYRLQGKYAEALSYYQQGLANALELGDPAAEAEILSGLGELFAAQDQFPLAIVFFKQAISTYEQIRTENQGLSQQLKDSYAEAIEVRYRRLADLLLQQDRVLEAQQVLDLLKIQELDDYLRGVAKAESALSILSPEQSILDKHNELVTSTVNLSQELAKLQETAEEERSEQQNQRIDIILGLQEELTQEFLSFSRSQEIQNFVAALIPAIRNATIQLESFNLLQKDLPDLNAALIYPLILEDRLEVVTLLPNTPPLRRTVEGLTKTELNNTILELRRALDDPNENPLPAAQQLYQWIIEPAETDLAAAGVDSLLYAPDGQLRYVPLAALHDGDRWLVERFGINNITAQSLSEYDDAPTAQPRILAGAFADTSKSHTVEVDGKTLSFSGLPYAGVELDNLQAVQPDIKTFLDEDFSLQAVKRVMNEYEVLHFATHAAFVNSKPEDSFILFGNGETPNVLDIGSWNLSNVDLVVLSACETGLDGFGNGAEILGMGYQFQLSGAGAVMASLWSVSDRGTQSLMTQFYDRLSDNQPKAKALQQAQIALINSSDEEIAEAVRGGGLTPAGNRQDLPESLKGFRHPHYWAPFIIIGNGL